MLKSELIERLLDKINTVLPTSLKELPDELKIKLKQHLNQALNDCEIVTQEEFQAYLQALQRTEQRLKALEAKLAELEQQEVR